jgi:hypothetical protein
VSCFENIYQKAVLKSMNGYCAVTPDTPFFLSLKSPNRILKWYLGNLLITFRKLSFI